jgi:hypothetical protein
MSKNFNGGRRDNGVGSAGNNNRGNFNNNGHVPTNFVDPRTFINRSTEVEPYTITTTNVQDFLQATASRVDRAIEQKIGAAKGSINTKVSVMSFNMSGKEEKKPFVPFIAMFSGNIIDARDNFANIPSVLKPDIDNGVHLNDVYYKTLIAPFIYNKDDIKAFNSASMRKQMHIRVNFRVLNTIKKYMKPTIEFTGKDHDNIENATVAVVIDPLRMFKHLTYDKSNPGVRYSVNVKSATEVDAQNYTFDVERIVNTHDNSSIGNIEILKQFFAHGNNGIR